MCSARALGIVEGDKLLCQGIWVDDAWGPIYQSKRVEIIGNVGDEGLRSRVAAACQAIQDSSTPVSGDGTPSAEMGDGDATKTEATEEDGQTWRAAVMRAFAEVARLSDAADKNKALRHDPQAMKAMKNAVAKYDGALDWADSLTIASPEIGGLDDSIRREMADAFQASENYDRLADRQMKLWANLRLQYFGRNNQHSLALEVQAIQRSNKLGDAAQNALEKERVALHQRRDALGL